MTKRSFQKAILMALAIFASAGLSFGQLNIEPKVSEINSQQNYVIVIKGVGTINAKVLMQDGNASSFDFDPNNMDDYPRWSISRVVVERGPNVKPLTYTTFQCLSNQEYFAYGNKGAYKMISQKEHDKYWERDAAGKYKYNITDMHHFIYREYVKDDNQYIKLTYFDSKEEITTTSVRMKSWPTENLKLVLVKL